MKKLILRLTTLGLLSLGVAITLSSVHESASAQRIDRCKFEAQRFCLTWWEAAHYSSHEACLAQETLACQQDTGSPNDWTCYVNSDGSEACIRWP